MKKQLLKATTMVLSMLFMVLGNIHAQSMTVTGTVTDQSDGSTLVGVSIQEKGTNNGVVTDLNGKYSLNVKKGATLVFSYIGYQKKEVKVKKSQHNVALEPELAVLEEVVVTSYATKQKAVMVGSVAGVRPTVIQCSESAYMGNSEEYNSISENRFQLAIKNPLSTFSIDVDAASYSNLRRHINQGNIPPKDAIRTEELVNYFTYDYKKPIGKDPVHISAEVGACPWNEQHRLVKIGLKAKEIADEHLPASNLVFLIDVSGSMYGPTRLELVKSSLKLLVNNLREKDRVAIVVYSGSAGEVLSSTPGSDKQKIREALDKLTSGGSTAGGEGIKLAYKIARNNFIKEGNNRVILCSDGDFNVGVSSVGGLESLIEEERKSGVFLTVLGYGMGNYKDNRMQTLAEKGNGNHAYIDNLQEANKVLVNEFGGTMHTVAKDVKLQVEFNPALVQAYRLVGYESRLLNNEDFNDDTKDAGEMGAGHTVTAFYEVVPVGVKSNFAGGIDDLKYQKKAENKPVLTKSDELLTIKLRYKQPDGNTSRKIELPVKDNKGNHVSADFRFAASVAMLGQLLRNSDYKGDASYDKVIKLAKTGLDNDEKGYRREFIRLAESIKGLAK